MKLLRVALTVLLMLGCLSLKAAAERVEMKSKYFSNTEKKAAELGKKVGGWVGGISGVAAGQKVCGAGCAYAGGRAGEKAGSKIGEKIGGAIGRAAERGSYDVILDKGGSVD